MKSPEVGQAYYETRVKERGVVALKGLMSYQTRGFFRKLI